MQCLSAPYGLGRRSDAAGNRPKSSANRSRPPHSVEKQSHQTLFCRLTPELSRPVAGRRTCASVAQSTWPTPRHGVGLNELLGGGGCRQKRNPSPVAEKRSGKARTRTRELSVEPVRNDSISRGETDRCKTPLPKPANATHAMCERASQTWTKW